MAKIPNWKYFIKKDITKKEAKELLNFAESEIKEWEDFILEIKARTK